MSIKNLKDLIKDLPEKNEYGDDFEVWLDNHDGTSDIACIVTPLNLGDILIGTRKDI